MRKQILLADDDESVRKMIARVLESAGFQVVNASTGSEAVVRFCSSRPDLVLLDLRMPDQDGWETFEQINRRDQRVPIVVITAWPNQQEQAAARGIDALMEKPLDMALLLATIQKSLTETEQTRTRREKERRLLCSV